MQSLAISVRGLAKHFDNAMAVDGISFDIPRNRIVALLGGNGAGKTTTISMLLGLLIPSAGSVSILGEDMLRHRYRVLPRINFSSPYVDLPKRLTARENLSVYAELYGVTRPKDRIARIAEELSIDEFMDRPTGQLSSGQKTRVALAKSLLNKPELLLLDEPTVSLDPDTASWVQSYLRDYQESNGATILLASHNMTEVERLASDVLIMKSGKIIDRGAPGALIKSYGSTSLEEVFLDIARGRNGDQPEEIN